MEYTQAGLPGRLTNSYTDEAMPQTEHFSLLSLRPLALSLSSLRDTRNDGSLQRPMGDPFDTCKRRAALSSLFVLTVPSSSSLDRGPWK